MTGEFVPHALERCFAEQEVQRRVVGLDDLDDDVGGANRVAGLLAAVSLSCFRRARAVSA